MVKAGQPARPKAKIRLKTGTGEEEVMPQYLVADLPPRRLRPVRRNRSDDGGDPRAQPRDDCCRREEVRLRPFPGRQREVAADAARRQGARHRRAVHRDQGAHGRFLDTGSCRSERGAGMGDARLPSPAVRRARCASFFSTRPRREQRNSLTRARPRMDHGEPADRLILRRKTMHKRD